MLITLFMLAWIWIADQVWLLVVPALMLAVRGTYTSPKLKFGPALAISGVALCITFAFWLLATQSFDVAALTAMRAALTSLVIVRSYLGADRVLNEVTIRVPVLRTFLFFFSRWLSSVIEILDDIRYAHRLESRRGTTQNWRLIVYSFGAAAMELVNLIERLLLVIFARGRYPNLTVWFTPWPLVRKVVFLDATLVLLAIGVIPMIDAQSFTESTLFQLIGKS